MRTLLVCVLASTLIGCSRQPTLPSCVGPNPLACLTAVHVPLERESYDSDSATTKQVSAVLRTSQPIKVATRAGAATPTPLRFLETNQRSTGNAVASEGTRASVTDPHSTTGVPQTQTRQEQAASAVAERMSAAAMDASPDAKVAVLMAGPGVKPVSDLTGTN